MSVAKLQVPDLHFRIEPISVPPEAVVEIAKGLQLAALLPTAEFQVPNFRALSRETRRAWSLLLRRFADALDPCGNMHEQLTAFGTYQDNWDDEGAPAPSRAAIDRAHTTLDWAEMNGVSVVGVDPDVVGGIGVFLENPSDGSRRAWIACMNDGSDTAVLSLHDQVSEHFIFGVDDESPKRVLRFLEVVVDAETD